MSQAALPTYNTVADVLEKQNGSGLRLAGWTVLRMIMIAPPMMVVGVPTRQAFLGAGLSSALISAFTLLRIFDAKTTGLAGVSSRRSSGRARARRPKRG
jgi:hypothetical protein